MMRMTLFALSMLLFVPLANAGEKTPVKILDISSYSSGAAFTTPTRQGFDMVINAQNSVGGVLGRPIEIIHADDTGKPETAVTKLQQLLLTEKPDIVTGCNLANIELAFSSYAQQHKMIFISACVNSDTSVWQQGNDYMYRGAGPLLYSFNAMMAERAAQQHKMRWGTINHNYAWGQDNIAAFKTNLAKYEPQAQWVQELWTPISKIDAGSVVNVLLQSNVDAVYTSLWGSDLVQFLREAKKRGLTDKVLIVGDNVGRPEFMAEMGGSLPVGIITTGMQAFEHPLTPDMKSFAEKYMELYHQDVRMTALESYLTGQVICAAIEKAQSVETDALIAALKNLEVKHSLFGDITVRDIDNVPTNGIWIGETAIVDGKPVLINAEYKEGKNYFPSDAEIEQMRK